MKKSFGLMIVVVLVLGFSGISSAVQVNDGGDSPYGPIDLISADAEVYDRGDTTLLKLTIEAAPNMPGAITFECDVDNSTGTGGQLSQIGTPVPPCPCKVEPGFDVIVALYTRTQGDAALSALASFCEIGPALPNLEGTPCARRRESGEWYAVASAAGQPVTAIGVLRGLLDPVPYNPAKPITPPATTIKDAYTLPWGYIIYYTSSYLQETQPGDPANFSFTKASANNYGDGKWQVSIFYDADAPTTDQDDVADGPAAFNINDFAPNTGKGDMTVSGGATDLTFCEGNFDGDTDVDGGDAAKFKANFGRSGFKNPCPPTGPTY